MFWPGRHDMIHYAYLRQGFKNKKRFSNISAYITLSLFPGSSLREPFV